MYAIELHNVSKKFTIRYDKSFHFKGEIYALKDVNLKIQKGQVFGIIGRNGSGKTTLLNIIAGIMSPTKGKVKVDGKVSSLLTLGAGFQHDLSGRENIFLNGSLLGMSNREIRKKFYDIVKFSELEGFLDKPLQSYSQGMKMRLGFSVACHVDFDVLLIDEILSVGDLSFQGKSYEKIERFRREGKTMVVVSQTLDMIERLCDNVVLLEKGEVIGIGHPHELIKEYQKLLNTRCFSEVYSDLQNLMVEREIRWWGKKDDWGVRMGTKEIEITNVDILNSQIKNNKDNLDFKVGDDITVKVDFIVHREIREPHFGVAIFREDGVYCYGPNTSFDGYRFKRLKKGTGSFSIEYKNLCLMPEGYRFSIAIWDKKELLPYDYLCGFYKFKITGQKANIALVNLYHLWRYRRGIALIFDKIRFLICNSIYKFKSIRQDDEITSANSFRRGLLKIMDKIGSPYKEDRMDTSTFFIPEFDFGERWGKNFGLGGIYVRDVEFLDKDFLLRNFFNIGELMQIHAELKYDKCFDLSKPCSIWFGIFREDKVYCHGVVRKLAKDEKEVVLVYPHMNLLTGRYYLSVGIWQEGGVIIDCHHGVFPFEIYSHKQDHGTVYIDHKWRWNFNG